MALSFQYSKSSETPNQMIGKIRMRDHNSHVYRIEGVPAPLSPSRPQSFGFNNGSFGINLNLGQVPIQAIQISAPPQVLPPPPSGRSPFKIVWDVMCGNNKKKDSSFMAGSSSSAPSDSLSQMSLSSPRWIDENIYSTSRNSDVHQIDVLGSAGDDLAGLDEVNTGFNTLTEIALKAIRAPIITAAKLSSDFYLWVLRRNSRQVRYHPQVENLLFEESMFLKLICPAAGAFITIIVASYNQSHGLTDSSFQALVNLLLELTSFSLLFLMVGEGSKLTIPEVAVISMLVSKSLIYTSFILVMLELIFTNIYGRLPVYLAALFLFIPLVHAVVNIIRYDVREPEVTN